MPLRRAPRQRGEWDWAAGCGADTWGVQGAGKNRRSVIGSCFRRCGDRHLRSLLVQVASQLRSSLAEGAEGPARGAVEARVQDYEHEQLGGPEAEDAQTSALSWEAELRAELEGLSSSPAS